MVGAPRKHWLLWGCASALAVALCSRAQAGSIEGGIGACELGSFSRCEWKPTGCYKPSKPFLYAADVDSYNEAVEEYNLYLDRIRRYLDCLVNEARDDIASKFPDTVKSSVDDLTNEATREVRSLKSDLDIARIGIR